jgi:hypothetical protein
MKSQTKEKIIKMLEKRGNDNLLYDLCDIIEDEEKKDNCNRAWRMFASDRILKLIVIRIKYPIEKLE